MTRRWLPPGTPAQNPGDYELVIPGDYPSGRHLRSFEAPPIMLAMDTQPQPVRHTMQSPPLQGTASAANAIARVSFTHDAVIDLIIARPELSQGEIAKMFGYRQAWLSRVMNSDAFLARLAQRKADIVDPTLVATIDEKLRALASVSLEVLIDKISITQNPDMALKGAELAVKALGYGARPTNVAVQQNNFVVPLPPIAANAQDWAAANRPAPAGLRQMVEEVTARDEPASTLPTSGN